MFPSVLTTPGIDPGIVALARDELTTRLKLGSNIKIDWGGILGTGFARVLDRADIIGEVELAVLPGFAGIPPLHGHPRKLVLLRTPQSGKLALIQVGRFHRYELQDQPGLNHLFSRLQVELPLALGIRRYLMTCAAGSLNRRFLKTGDLCVVRGFITKYGRPMPLVAGEFVPPHLPLNPELRAKATTLALSLPRLLPETMEVKEGRYLTIPGPAFATPDDCEGHKQESDTIGMSLAYECSILACHNKLHKCGNQALCLACVTDDDGDDHPDDDVIKARAEALSEPLGALLLRLFEHL
ncbi:MAG: hypothetical protein V1821_03100 [bacterium]